MNKTWQGVEYNKNQVSGIDEIFQCNGIESILSKIHNHAYICLNVDVTASNYDTFPEGHGLYVLSFSQEIFVEDWFLQVYNKHKTARFIILGNFYPGDLAKFNRVQFIRILDCLWYKQHVNYQPIDWSLKKYKISSLSYYVNEFRFFVTAALLGKTDVLYSWHNQYRSVSNFDYIFQPTGNTNRDSLLKCKQQLDNIIQLDNFDNSAYVSNLQRACNHPAYTESVVNCINETKDVSWHPEFGHSPTPYLSEKTWKAISSGNALLFSSQANTEHFLKELGFNFSYPWNSDYASILGDLDRLEKIISLLDQILEISMQDLIDGVKESCEYNLNYFFSKEFDKVVNDFNGQSLEKLEKLL